MTSQPSVSMATETTQRVEPPNWPYLPTVFVRPNTLLIDSEQLESGEGLDDNFRNMASDEIERFRCKIERVSVLVEIAEKR